MVLYSILIILKELGQNLISFFRLIFSLDIIHTIIAVFVGGFLSSLITRRQVSDSNRFIVLNQARNEIMSNVDNTHENVNRFIISIGKICEVIQNSNDKTINNETRFILMGLTNDVTTIINSSRRSGNVINSNVRLLKLIFKKDNAVFDRFQSRYFENHQICTTYMNNELNKMLDLMDKNQRNEISIQDAKKLASSQMFKIFHDTEIQNFMNSTAFELYEFINTKINYLVAMDEPETHKKEKL